MKIFPIACESLGTRSLCHLVMTESINILVDPSVSLGPKRFGLKPHPLEIAASWISRQTIMELRQITDVIIQTHYHGDHFTLNSPRKYEFSNSEIFRAIYNPDVTILAKDHEKNINYNQQKRAKQIWKNEKLDISKADNSSFDFGSTSITFSPAVPHGIQESEVFVIEVMIQEDDASYIFTSDVCGPSSKEATDFIISNSPNKVVVDGVPFYISSSEKYIEDSFQNLAKIVDEISEVYIDHHFLRSMEWENKLQETLGKKLPTFSMMRHQEPFLLEAQRKLLHKEQPVKEDFYHSFYIDNYSVTYFKELLHKRGIYNYWKNLKKAVNEENKRLRE
jgi:predicted metallo-beta-lactamase superfamily hydrolase